MWCENIIKYILIVHDKVWHDDLFCKSEKIVDCFVSLFGVVNYFQWEETFQLKYWTKII